MQQISGTEKNPTGPWDSPTGRRAIRNAQSAKAADCGGPVGLVPLGIILQKASPLRGAVRKDFQEVVRLKTALSAGGCPARFPASFRIVNCHCPIHVVACGTQKR